MLDKIAAFEYAEFIPIASIIIGIVLLVAAIIVLLRGKASAKKTESSETEREISVDYEITFAESTEVIE